jgi:DNA-binding MarR family transcriptional regulator
MSNYNIAMRKNNAVALISRIREHANRLIVGELAARGVEGMVPSHGDIMFHLYKNGYYTMQELAAAINRTKPTVTVLVDKLADMGYVRKEKSAADSRVTIVRPTEKGLALEPVFREISAKLNAIVYGGMSEAEAEAFERTLAAVKGRLDGQ